MSNIVMMEMLSLEYGWTPNEIREQPKDDIKRYVKIIRLRRLIDKKHG